MKTLRPMALAATLAAVCVLPVLAGPDGDPGTCDPGTPGCPLAPPQSVQVNPHPLNADGTSVEVPTSGAFVPVEVVAPMPAPRFMDPLALGLEGGSSLGRPSSSGNGTSSEIVGSDSDLQMGAGEAGSSGADGPAAGSVGAAQALALAGLGAMGVVATASPALRGQVHGRSPTVGAAGRATRVGGSRAAGSQGGNSAPKDREERMLPRASWIPGGSSATSGQGGAAKALYSIVPPPPTPSPTGTPTPPGGTPEAEQTPTPAQGGITPAVTPRPQPRGYRPGAPIQPASGLPLNTLTSKFAGMVRGFANAELRDSLISGAVGGVASLSRQAGIAAAGVVSRAAQGQLPSLERAINGSVEAIGGAVDRLSDRLNNGVQALGAKFDNATGPIGGRINAWAVGEAVTSGEGRGYLRGAWEGTVNRVRSAGAALLQPNSPRFDARVSAVGGFGAGMSLVGNLVGARTGIQAWKDVGGVGDVISGSANLVGLRSQIANVAQWASGSPAVQSASRFAGLASAAVKVSGVLSAVTGVYTAVTEYQNVRADLMSNGGRLSDNGKIAAVKAATGAAAALGGVLLLTPAAPVGGVILAVSGIASAVTWGYENRERLWNGLKAYQGVARNAATIANVVTQRAVTAVSQSPVGRAVQSVASAVSQAASSVKGFLGQVFGGGGQASSPAPRPVPQARPATPTPARPTPQPTRSAPSPTASRSPSPVRSTPSPSRSPAPRSSPPRSSAPSRSPSSRFGR